MHFTNREIATILEALVFWGEWLNDEDAWIRDCTNFQTESPLSKNHVCGLVSRIKETLKRSDYSTGERFPAWSLSLMVPTYLGHRNAISESPEFGNDFTPANSPILICSADGIRVVLGTHDFNDSSKPDIQIERRPHGWALFVHPNASDPVACLYIHDDGRTFLHPERYVTDPIEVVDDIPRDLDIP